MYAVLVTRTVDGSSSLYGPFESHEAAESWIAHNHELTPEWQGWSYLALPILSTSEQRRRGQLAEAMAYGRGER